MTKALLARMAVGLTVLLGTSAVGAVSHSHRPVAAPNFACVIVLHNSACVGAPTNE